ncbi:MAG: HAD-IIIC family phosphatase [Anaerolineales bacterium]|nr:HAD-IIIC family phosphatase [Anaerolineales bacterium]
MSSSPEQVQELPPLKRALFAVKDLRARLNAIEAGQVEPIAVVGMACRFPGKATNPDKFWRLLSEGVDTIAEVPADRWDVEAFYDPDPDKPGKMITRCGGFIDQVDQFDAGFFGISPREATSMDPQQRLLLETSWEALERAGIAPEQLAGSLTAVYLGISTNDYVHLSVKSGSLEQIDPYLGTGGAFSVAAGRLSYLLGLQGPNLAVDTACSSSLVAVHLACQALRTRQANLAVVGGVNLILNPEASIYMSKARALSPDGRCKTFAAAADGYGRGEGCGVVILKRLSDAQAENDNVLAVIRGTAVNHDGRSSGLTVPNGQAQQEVIRAALQNAGGLDPQAIDYLEAHGTGTPLGDPIEVRAATAVLGKDRRPDNPLYIGSVKTNIGHLEAAAGMAGLIKLVLALQHNELPPHLHFDQPSPHIPWDSLPVQVVQERQPWSGENRLAGLSSFGLSGTNAHVIVGPAPLPEPASAEAERPCHLLTLSVRQEGALRSLAARYDDFLAENPTLSLADVAYTSSHGRSHFEQRLAVVAHTPADARQKLAAALANRHEAGPATPKIAFLFTGQGAQYAGMGQELYELEPAFREAIDQCAAVLDTYLERPLLSVLFAEDEDTGSLIHQTAYTQPGLFAIEYALAKLWLSWGVSPTAVMGHSIGEIVAACIAGIFSLEDALKLVAERGRLMQSLPPGGAMAAVFADEAQVAAAIAGSEAEVSIAALNGPQNVVISGTETAVSRILDRFAADGIKSRSLTVSHAFHSPLMEPVLPQFEQAARSLAFHKPRLRLISNLTGRQVQGDEGQTAVYWRDHIRQPVQFAPSVQTLLDEGITHFLEIGPQPTLLSMARYVSGVDAVEQLASLRRNVSDWEQMLTTLGSLYEAGVTVNWRAVYQHQSPRAILLPTYPFQRKRYWHDVTPQWTVRSASLPDTAVFDADEWFYRISWQAVESSGPGPSQPGQWLILADEGGVGDELAAQVQARGGQCHIVTQNQLQANNQTLAQWLSSAAQAGPLLQHVVYLWGLDTVAPLPAEEACIPVLHLLQHIAATPGPSPKLWLVTAGAQAVLDGESLRLAQSPLWGMGKTIALELPNLWGGLIDLHPGLEDGAAAVLLEEIQQADGEQETAWRDGRRYVARLAQAEPPTLARPLSLRPDGSYLITGGLGALGLYVAEWLVQQGARRLILLGRTPLPPRRDWLQIDPETAVGRNIAAVRRLEMAGAAIHTTAVDIGDAEQLAAFLADYAAEGWPPVRGVIHAAGVLADRSLLNMDDASFSEVFPAKARGAWHLHTLLGDAPLDFFVLFSSFAGMTGSAGQANYAAANDYLISLAHWRQAKGLPALVINWGAWADAGMAARADLAERRRRVGVASIEPAQGVALLGRLLASDVTAVGIMPVPAGQLRRLLPGELSLLADLPADGGEDTAVADTSQIREQILGSPAAERAPLMERYLQQGIADVLRLAPTDIATSRNVMELGLDSIMVMELIQRLDRELILTIYPREVFERPSVQALAAYLLTALDPMAEGTAAPAESPKQNENDMLTIPQRDSLPVPAQRNSRAVFLLSTPRAGSTLLRVMLAGHPQLFCPPELHLLPFNTLADREAELAGSYLDEGLQRAIMALTGQDAAASAATLAGWRAENLTVPEVYGRLQALANGRLLIDKSPSYALDIEVLRRAEQQFDGALYIHLVRHPYAVIDSFARNRMDRLLGQTDADSHQLGEQIWTTMNNNILDFRDSIGEERCFQLRYEDLVTEPESVMRQLCAFLGVEFLPALLLPYEGERMTDGVHSTSRAIGDPNFHKRQRIEASLADAWKTAVLPRRLGRASRQLAADFAYDLPWPLQPVPEPETATAVPAPVRREKPPIQPIERGPGAPLSYPQEQIWLAHQLEPESPQYNMPVTSLRLHGPIDATVLQQSVTDIVRRHTVLRTRFVLEGEEPRQVVDAASPVPLPVIDLSYLPPAARETEAMQQAQAEAKRPFDLEQGPLLRATLLRLSPDEHILLLIVHHIASDGWSVGVMMNELTALYQAFVAQRPSPLAELTIQYIDFAAWQRAWLDSGVLSQQLAYWERQLAGAPPLLDLPTDFARPALPDSTQGARETVMLPIALLEALRDFSRQRGVTPFMTLLAVLELTLFRWSGQSDLVIGTVVANRNQDETRPLIGCFMNFLALRTQFEGLENGAQLLTAVRSTVFDAYDNQDCPYAKVVEKIQPDRSLGQNPLYNVAFLLQNLRSPSLFGDDIQAEPVTLDTETSLLDLRFVGQETSSGLRMMCEYNTELFTAATIQQVLAFFATVLQQLLQEPALPLAQVVPPDELVAQAEASRRRDFQKVIAIAATFTAEPVEDALAFWMKQLQLPTRIEFAPYNQVFQQLLDPASLLRQNESGVNVILVRFEDWQRYANGDKDAFYREIERNMLDLAQVLETAVSKTPALVVICPPSPAMRDDSEKAAFLATMETTFKDRLKANPNVHLAGPDEILALYPVAEVADLYSDEMGHIPYTNEYFAALGTFLARKIDLLWRKPVKVLALDCDNTLWQGVVGEDGVEGIRISPAYQKLHRLLGEQLEAGRLVCLLSKNREADVREVFDQRPEMGLRWDQVTAVRINWQSKPENIRLLADELQLGLDSFVFLDDNPVECAAMQAHYPEVLTLQVPTDEAALGQFLDHTWVFDTLSLTAEDKKRAAFYQQNVKREQIRRHTVTIGDFLAQLEMQITIAPPKPEQMARVAQLTQRTNQFNATTIRRQTGDLQQMLESGRYACLTAEVRDRFGDYGLVGVVIFQKQRDVVEVDTLLLSCRAMGRGVEHEMLRHVALEAQNAGVSQITVCYVPSARNQPALDFLESVPAGTKQADGQGWVFEYPVTAVTHLTYRPQPETESDGPQTGAGVATHESYTLTPAPSHRVQQIAAELATVDQILQAIEQQNRRQRPKGDQPYAAPRTELEQTLAQLWCSLLGVEQVSIYDNFFELGGHSLLATRLLARIHEKLAVDIRLRDFFETPTIATLAEQIETLRWLSHSATADEETLEEREEFEI